MFRGKQNILVLKKTEFAGTLVSLSIDTVSLSNETDSENYWVKNCYGWNWFIMRAEINLSVFS